MTDETDIMRKILTYLADHPEASDTVEGIGNRWISGGPLRVGLAETRRALDQLVRAGLVLESHDSGGKPSYRINPDRVAHVQKLIRGG